MSKLIICAMCVAVMGCNMSLGVTSKTTTTEKPLVKTCVVQLLSESGEILQEWDAYSTPSRGTRDRQGHSNGGSSIGFRDATGGFSGCYITLDSKQYFRVVQEPNDE